jgi:hypothetical protein
VRSFSAPIFPAAHYITGVPNLDDDACDDLPPLEPDEIESSVPDLEGMDLDEAVSLDDSVLGDQLPVALAEGWGEGAFSEGAERDAEPMPGDFAGEMLLFDDTSARDDATGAALEDADLSFLDLSANDDSGEEGPSLDADAIEEHTLPPIDAGDDDEGEPQQALADEPAPHPIQGPKWAVVGPRIALTGCYEVAPIARGVLVASQAGLFRVDLEGGRELLLGGNILSVAAGDGTTACVDDAGTVHVCVGAGAGEWATSSIAGAREVRIVSNEVLVLTEGGGIQALHADESPVNDAAGSHPLRQSWPPSVVAWATSPFDVLFVHATRADRVRLARRSMRGEEPLVEFEIRPELLTAIAEVWGEVAFVIDGRLRIAGHGDVTLPGRVIALAPLDDVAWFVACEDRVHSGLVLYRISPTGGRTRLAAISGVGSGSGVGSDLEPNSVHIAAVSETLVWLAGTFGIVAVSVQTDAQSPS